VKRFKPDSLSFSALRNGSLTTIFWGIFLIWFGILATTLSGNLIATVNAPTFALGTGVLLLIMNLVRSLLRLKLSAVTIGLGALLTIINGPVVLFSISVPFLPELLIIAGVALIIAAFRARDYFPPRADLE